MILPTSRNQKKRDWFQILRDLMQAGISMSQVARTCGKTVKSVAHWGNGGDPKDFDARVILALYAQHCPAKFQQHMLEYGFGNKPTSLASQSQDAAADASCEACVS